MLHLHIGVYVLFLRLYGMFPCTFLSFLRVHYAKKENLMVYHDVIAVSMANQICVLVLVPANTWNLSDG